MNLTDGHLYEANTNPGPSVPFVPGKAELDGNVGLLYYKFVEALRELGIHRFTLVENGPGLAQAMKEVVAFMSEIQPKYGASDVGTQS